MLTYCTLKQFRDVKQMENADDVADSVIEQYLRRATRFIDSYCKRRFFPWRETREYTIPSEYINLRLRSFPGADLLVDQDLLEIIQVLTGDFSVSDPAPVELFETDDFNLLPFNLWPKWGLRLVWPNFWTGTFSANIGGSYRIPSIRIDAVWGFSEDMDYDSPWEDTGIVLPGGGLSDSATTLTIAGTGLVDAYGEEAIPVGALIRLEHEFCEVLAVNENTNTAYTIKRGVNGTTPVAHDAGTAIRRWRVAPEIVEACYQISKAWREHDMVTGGRQGVSQMSVGVELDIPPDAKFILQSKMRAMGVDQAY